MKCVFLRPVVSGAIFLLLASGCARVGGTTEVKADGGFTRTLVFVGEKPATTGAGGMSMTPTIDKMVIVPRSAGWSVAKTYKESEVTITATKTFAPGEAAIDDIGIKEGADKPGSVLANTASVTKRPDGRLEYREVIRWRGPKTDAGDADKEIIEGLKKALPAGQAADSAALATTAKLIQKDVIGLLLGPGEPLFGLLLTHPDYAQFKLKKALGGSVRKALETGFGDQLSESERTAAIRAIVSDVSTKASSSAKPTPPGAAPSESGDGKKSDNSSLVAMLLRVHLPGKIVETNGELDPESGEIVWPLYSQAAAAGDITLTAVCDP